MGRVLSVYASLTQFRGFLGKRRGNDILVEKIIENREFNEKFSEAYVTVVYPDISEEVVKIPPVKDPETKEILIKKKVAEVIGTSGENLIIYFEVPEESSPTERAFKVYAIPQNIFSEDNYIDENIRTKLHFFTVSSFSLAGISKLLFPEDIVFHAFGDEENLVITVNHGDDIIYMRIIQIPAYAKESEESYEDFAYENINMTYIYVAQRKNIKVDRFLISGKLKDSERLVQNLINLIPSGVSSPIPPENIRNIDALKFHELLPAFGTFFIPETYDFSPLEAKKVRKLNNLIRKAIPALMVIFLISFTLFTLELKRVFEDLEMLRILSMRVDREYKKVMEREIIRTGLYEYYIQYLLNLYESRERNPFIILSDIKELLKLLNSEEEYVFQVKKNVIQLRIKGKRQFGRAIAMTEFKNKLNSALQIIKRKNREINYKIERLDEDYNNYTINYIIVLERKI